MDSVQISHGKGPHLVVSCMVHGNEVDNLPPLIKIIQEMEGGRLYYPGTFTVLLGNRSAALQAKRFLEYDMNRLFAWEGEVTPELHRVLELKKVIANADLYIDFHQTIQPTQEAFWTVAFSPLIAAWSRALGGTCYLLTRKTGDTFASGLMTTDEYGRSQGVPSLTIETSAISFARQADRVVIEVLRNAFSVLPQMASTRDIIHVGPFAEKNPPLKYLVRIHKENFAHPSMELRPGIKNFDFVKKGEMLGKKSVVEAIVANHEGYVIFPKYPERNDEGLAVGKLPSDLFCIYKEVDAQEL